MALSRDIEDLARALDQTMVRVPAGTFAFGMTAEQKLAEAQRENLHLDQLHFHTRVPPKNSVGGNDGRGEEERREQLEAGMSVSGRRSLGRAGR